jgi:5-methyltetrahydropteroyltriglutamate--homocysteine methyltransferase
MVSLSVIEQVDDERPGFLQLFNGQKKGLSMATATNLGYPRIGARRELKKALESYWSGRMSEGELLEQVRLLRRDNWLLQQQLGLEHIPSGDFSLYDHVLDTVAMVGAVPARYGWTGGTVNTQTYFAMARGVEEKQSHNGGGDALVAAPAMEMTKWFDTNYHYIVPEFEQGQSFRLSSRKPIDEFAEARDLGIHTRPVLLGPVSFLLLGKSRQHEFQPLTLLHRLLPVYEEILRGLSEGGADWIQIDEPCLVLDLDEETQNAFQVAYEQLAIAVPKLRILLATYFGDLGHNLSVALHLPVATVHLDLVRAPEQLDRALAILPAHCSLSLGVVDGRNVWRTDLEHGHVLIQQAVRALGSDRVFIGPSCSLLHCPVDLEVETRLDSELREWIAFARQKVEEIVLLTRAVNDGLEAVELELRANRAMFERRRSSPRIHDKDVQGRVASINEKMLHRQSPYPKRRPMQRQRLQLPLFPTTTIGSFPQTKEIRGKRADCLAGLINAAEYEAFLREEIVKTIHFQEEIDLDVLVHGESERSDMVEYFGERLSGVAITQNGWVQSYGSRCVRPPVIYGDVSRPQAMTVNWSRFAQSLTSRPVKGMLTGPVTLLQWSFVRDDQPRSQTCQQIALAINDEVLDLEAAGIRVIQIDEPALREGLPLRHDDWDEYLTWAVNCFRLTSACVQDEAQIHTHMCYAEFNDIIEAIGKMDADVLLIESARSQMELLGAFADYRYPNEIGPGVYDIHSPRIPSRQEMENLLRKALQVLSPEQLWVNPDCGLKTRSWEEIRPALRNMVEAARNLRAAMAS